MHIEIMKFNVHLIIYVYIICMDIYGVIIMYINIYINMCVSNIVPAVKF